MRGLRFLHLLWVNLSVLVLLSVVCEFGAWGYYSVRRWLNPPRDMTLIDVAALPPDAYPNQQWVIEYFNDFERSAKARWFPYVYYRRSPYASRYINVDMQGMRRTWRDAPEPRSRPLRVFCFGGSTMWGSGARDEFTIPSSLARMLVTEFPGRVEVFNFGQSGYVSTQEMIAFLRELQYDNRPDIALFYDGYNDMYSSFQQGTAGLPQNEFNREQEFNLHRPSRTLELVKALVRQSHVYMLLQGVAKRPTAGAAVANREQLARETARIYAENIRLLEALGKSEGVGMLFYLQPSVFTKTARTPYENSWFNRYLTQAVLMTIFTRPYGKPLR